MSAAGAPSLLCLNIRREHFRDAYDANTKRALQRAGEVLRAFRTRGWPVLHAYAVRQIEPNGVRGALHGLEPIAKEPVFALHTLSPFSEPQLIEAADRARPMCLHLIGGVYSRSGLAAVLAAQELNIRLNIMRDACFQPGVESVAETNLFEAALSDGASAARIVNCLGEDFGMNVIVLDAHRP